MYWLIYDIDGDICGRYDTNRDVSQSVPDSLDAKQVSESEYKDSELDYWHEKL